MVFGSDFGNYRNRFMTRFSTLPANDMVPAPPSQSQQHQSRQPLRPDGGGIQPAAGGWA